VRRLDAVGSKMVLMRRPLVLLLTVGVLLLVVAMVLGEDALGDPPPCTASSIALSSDRTATDANNTTASLTLTLDHVLCGSYHLSLYDDQGNRLAYWSPDGYLSHSWSVTPANNQSRTYTAYVSLDTPTPGPPGSVSSSSSVTITNQGWLGHVTLTTDRTATDANNTTASLTLTLDRLIAGPYHLSLYDDQGNRLAYWSPDGYLTHSWSVTPANNQSRTYTAYVSQDTPAPGPPSNDVRSTNSVTITNQGWIGSLQVSSNRNTVDSANPTATLTLTLDRQLAGPYHLSLYDDQGNRLAYWSPDGYLSHSWSVTPPLNQTRTYTAYVSQDTPSPGPPSNDVRADSGLTYSAGTLTALRIEGLNVADITSTHSDEEVELALSAWPLATHAEGSSLSDQALAYSGYLAAGLVSAYALEKVIAAEPAGSDLAAWMVAYFDPSEPAPEPTVIPDAPTAVLPPEDLSIPRSLEEAVTESILRRTKSRAVSREDARTIARKCIREVALAGLAPIDGKNPCEQLPIFVPGYSAPLTTAHDDQAIAANPAWARLNFVSGSERDLSRGWYTTYEPCIPPYPMQGVQCDEYPFYASAQSGPGASLQLIDELDNQRAGGFYNAFANTYCHLKGPTTSPDPLGDPFLVVPLLAVPTIPDICAA
jgi:deoxyribonuclease NucA/NucB